MQTKFDSACLLSLRMKEVVCTSNRTIMEYSNVSTTKTLAYLLDQRTIGIKDLANMTMSSVEHSVAIDFLELNTSCSHLIFRDKKQNLILYNMTTRAKNLILLKCGYTQWIPSTDVLVAQSGDKMSVWYNIHIINQVSFFLSK